MSFTEERFNAGAVEAVTEELLVFQGRFILLKYDNDLRMYQDVGYATVKLVDVSGSLPFLDVTSIEDASLLLRAELFRGMEAGFDGPKRQLKLSAGDIGDVRRYRLDGCEVERLCAAVVSRANLLQYRPDIPPADQISNFVDKCDEFRAAAMRRTTGLWWMQTNGVDRPTANCDPQPVAKPLQDAETQEAPVEVKSGNDEKVNIGSLLTVCDEAATLRNAGLWWLPVSDVERPGNSEVPQPTVVDCVKFPLPQAEFKLYEFTTSCSKSRPLGSFSAEYHNDKEPACIEFKSVEDSSLVLSATVDETLRFEANETTWSSFRLSGYDELNNPKMYLVEGRPGDVRRLQDLVNSQEQDPVDDDLQLNRTVDYTATGESAVFQCADCVDSFRSHRALRHHERDRHGRATLSSSTTKQTTKRRQTTNSSARSNKFPKVAR